ncbi:unnamed protein product [Caenorhabditis auriculariae]|uniref:FYVE-type domain-containing protein n=1 Tax=Caenorhabditis auriculariae TaxID=2777116 RepID=A0A8S1HA13_9PELO|nr:unnamed protein product [Caenorhabditis auriculariae]
MEDVPDMDSLLDELESDVCGKLTKSKENKAPIGEEVQNSIKITPVFPNSQVPLDPQKMVRISVTQPGPSFRPFCAIPAFKSNGVEEKSMPSDSIAPKKKKINKPVEVSGVSSERSVDPNTIDEDEYNDLVAYLDRFEDPPKKVEPPATPTAAPEPIKNKKEEIQSRKSPVDPEAYPEEKETVQITLKKCSELDDLYRSDVADDLSMSDAAEEVARNLVDSVCHELELVKFSEEDEEEESRSSSPASTSSESEGSSVEVETVIERDLKLEGDVGKEVEAAEDADKNGNGSAGLGKNTLEDGKALEKAPEDVTASKQTPEIVTPHGQASDDSKVLEKAPGEINDSKKALDDAKTSKQTLEDVKHLGEAPEEVATSKQSSENLKVDQKAPESSKDAQRLERATGDVKVVEKTPEDVKVNEKAPGDVINSGQALVDIQIPEDVEVPRKAPEDVRLAGDIEDSGMEDVRADSVEIHQKANINNNGKDLENVKVSQNAEILGDVTSPKEEDVKLRDPEAVKSLQDVKISRRAKLLGASPQRTYRQTSSEHAEGAKYTEEVLTRLEAGRDTPIVEEVVLDLEISEDHGAMEAIEVANSPVLPSKELAHENQEINEVSATDVEELSDGRPRFDSIATVHVLESDSEESSGTPSRRPRRLTESELQLGKTMPYWIPDTDCAQCMLCSARFTLLTRRHHCRACGRLLCGNCCNERATLEYLNTEGKKPQPSRVCTPCSKMLGRIAKFEQEEANQRLNPSTSDSEAPTITPKTSKGVLKVRSASMAAGEAETDGAGSSNGGSESVRRSVMFRDGIRPGASTSTASEEERTTVVKPKKKSRKRYSVVRRIAELRMEDELACAIPTASQRCLLLVNYDKILEFREPDVALKNLRDGFPLTVMLKKNLSCIVQIVHMGDKDVWTVGTQGFAQIGLDELFFAWVLKEKERQTVFGPDSGLTPEVAANLLPYAVFHRISNMYTNSTEKDNGGVCRVSARTPTIHSVPMAVEPLTRHILLFPPTVQDFSPFIVPKDSFLVACFLHDSELQWAMASPNRLLLRLGLKYGWYPTPIVNFVDRAPIYSTETASTVLKVFTDFRSWTFRMRHIYGCTVSLSNEMTLVQLPRNSMSDLMEIMQWNRMMLAWSCDISVHDDSHLVCDESEPGSYNTQVFARFEGRRHSTGASFVILDGGLKVNSLQVSVVEDGVAIRVQPDRLSTILDALSKGEEVVEKDEGMELRIEFVGANFNAAPHGPKSAIDEHCLLNKYQYGLSIERALSQVFQIQGVADHGIRLSQVYSLSNSRLTPEEEPKVFGIVEVVARECSAMLGPFMETLIERDINKLSVRLLLSPENVEYDISRWPGLPEDNAAYRQSLDQLIPILYNMLDVVPNGFEVEFVLSIVSTKALPVFAP